MKLETFAIMLLVLLAAFYAGWYFYDNFGDDLFAPEQAVVEQPALTQQEAEKTSPRLPMPPRHPVSLPERQPEATASQPAEPAFPLTLAEGDAYLKQRLPQLIEKKQLISLLTLKYFIQKMVVIIDHLPESSIPRQHLPIIPPEPGFKTVGTGDQQVIAKGNAKRYRSYIDLLEAIPDDSLLRLYRGLYPLFQQAYRETGKPHGHFNDRLVLVIDHLLKTPEPQGPLTVTRHISRFKYSDPHLESLSFGQKLLLRIGKENRTRAKNKLRRFRDGLVAHN